MGGFGRWLLGIWVAIPSAGGPRCYHVVRHVTTWRRFMGTVGVRELKAHASEMIARLAAGERFVITKRGLPVGVLLPLAAADVEDLILAEAEPFVEMRRRARREHARGESVSWRAARGKAGVK